MMTLNASNILSNETLAKFPALCDILSWEPEGLVSVSDVIACTKYSGDLNAEAQHEPSLNVVKKEDGLYISRKENPAEHYQVISHGDVASLGPSPLVWIDLEMTGLDLSKDKIIEVAVILSDQRLSRFVEGPNLIVHCDEATLLSMDEWCTQHHGDSGLTAAVRASSISLEQANDIIMKFLLDNGVKSRAGVLSGNSVHEDRAFIRFQMPRLFAHLHYRIVDVSSLKLLAAGWYEPGRVGAYRKRETHRALLDIRESIGELKHYRRQMFKTEGLLM